MTYDSKTISPEQRARLDALRDNLTGGTVNYGDGFPIDVAETIQTVCELWNLRPPTTKSRKAFWIKSARDLKDACGEFGVECLREYHKEFMAYCLSHGGVAKHTVAGPQSLVNMVSDKSARMRTPVVVEERNIARHIRRVE